jgi:ribosomal protein L11 methyltransferase
VTPSRASWTTIRVGTLHDRAAVITALFASGAEGVQELDDEILTHIANPDRERVRDAVTRADARATLSFSPTPDVDWSAEWRSRIGAHRLGAFVVTPPWLAGDFSPDERIVIEPAMAFGTGEHETTRGVIRLLQRVIRPGDTVADLGAGSAVLAIAAARLGASRVVAIEIDGDAIGNAQENVDRNQVGDRVTVIEGDARILLPLVAPVRVVLANIIAPVLLELLPTIGRSLTSDGVAILSGLLVEDREQMRAALDGHGWRVVELDEEGIWWSATIQR